MKINPVKNYKKPKYAVSLAVLTAVSTLSGCDPFERTSGTAPAPAPSFTDREISFDGALENPPDYTQTEEPTLSGDVVVISEETVTTTAEPPLAEESSEEISEHPGHIAVISEETEEEIFELAGDVAVIPDEELHIDGGMVVAEDELAESYAEETENR